MLSHTNLRANVTLLLALLASVVVMLVVGIAFHPEPAFAKTSIKYGWIALDANKKPVLQGSQYTLSGPVKPIAYISNGVTTAAVNSKSVVYLSNTKAGTGQALIIGDNILGGYQDAFITTFTIVKGVTDISKMSISNISDQAYTGNTIMPAVTVKTGSKTLKPGSDYRITYSNNINIGTAKATITGQNGYAGTKTINFKIVKADVSKAVVADIKDRYADGLTKVTPEAAVKMNGRLLKKGTDYTVTYTDKDGKKTTPKNPGTYKVVIKGKGKYTGSKTVKFKLVNIGDDLARYACKMSYSRRDRGAVFKESQLNSSDTYNGTKFYKASGARRGCHSAMYGAYKGSGYWKAFKSQNYDAESGYKSSKTRWRYIGNFVPGKRVTSTGIKLLPGDTLCGQRGGYHTCMYVGKSIPKEIYKDYIKPTTAKLKKQGYSTHQAKRLGGDLGSPVEGTDFVSASYHSIFMACYCTAETSFANQYGSSMKIYRLVQPDIKKYRAGNVVK